MHLGQCASSPLEWMPESSKLTAIIYIHTNIHTYRHTYIHRQTDRHVIQYVCITLCGNRLIHKHNVPQPTNIKNNMRADAIRRSKTVRKTPTPSLWRSKTARRRTTNRQTRTANKKTEYEANKKTGHEVTDTTKSARAHIHTVIDQPLNPYLKPTCVPT